MFGEGLGEEIFLKHLRGLYAKDSGVSVMIRKGKGGTPRNIVIGAANEIGSFDRRVAILDNDNQITLEKYFKSWPNEAKSRVLEVCIDMKQSYLSVLKEIFPKANIVIDRFHIVKEMNRRVDEMRKILQPEGGKGLRRIHRFLLLKSKDNLNQREREILKQTFKVFRKHPALEGAYFVKEKVAFVFAIFPFFFLVPIHVRIFHI